MNLNRTETDLKLIPSSPPGRANRKARVFEIEIARLRAEGYSCEAIREALANAGVHVSKSTMQREVARLNGQLPSAGERAPVAQPHGSPTLPLPAITTAHLMAYEPRSGRDIAETFVKGRITNPLIRTRSRDEDCRH